MRNRQRLLTVTATTVLAAAALAVPHSGPACQVRGELPDRSCTPGQVDPTITAEQVCNGQAAGRPRRVSARMKREAILAYGMAPATFHGEIDHLVSRQLGGADTPDNLWPEAGPIPNPKDAVENALRRAVCDGRITLAEAQRRIATDWTTALPH